MEATTMNEQQAQELMNTPTKPGLVLLHTVKLGDMEPFAALAVRHVLHGNQWTDQYLQGYARTFSRADEYEHRAREEARNATNNLLEQLTKAKGKVIRKWSTAEDAPIAFAQLHTSRANSVRLYIREGAPAEDLQAFRSACVDANSGGRYNGPYQGTPLALRDFDDWSMDYPGTNTGRLSMNMRDAEGDEHPHLVLDSKSAWIRRVGAVGTLLGKHNTWGGKSNSWASTTPQVSTLDTMIGRAKALIADDFSIGDEVRDLGQRAAAVDGLDYTMYGVRSTYGLYATDVERHATTWGNDEWVARYVEAERAKAEAEVERKVAQMNKMEQQLRDACAKVVEVLGDEAAEAFDRALASHKPTGAGLGLVQQIVAEVSA
jgi:hypothetical protein